ncbi:MAG: RHS repeat protein, partial [Xanthomonadales bacterium]|nr:RHS repeat protein [Xanthomonadales bacterium]
MITRTAATTRNTHEASRQSWLRSFLERRFLSRGRESLKRRLRVLASIAWMLVLSPGSLLASWEVPAGQLAARTERFEVSVLCEAPNFAYDNQDDLVTHTDRRGIAHAYRYDHEHRATRYQRAGVTQWTREHDAVGNVLADTDANNHTTTSTYDPANQRKTSTRNGQTRSWSYTPTNQIETQTDASGAVTRFGYNLRDQLLKQTNGANETTTFTVDGDGLQTTRTLDGETWTNTFDAAHRLTGVESPEAHETIYGYNADDALVSITDGNLHVTTLDVDSQGRITRRTYPGAAVFSTTYDGNGNARSDTTPEHSYSRTFDALNRLRSETAASITRTQSFDGNGNRLTASLGADTTRTQTYDPHNRPLS